MKYFIALFAILFCLSCAYTESRLVKWPFSDQLESFVCYNGKIVGQVCCEREDDKCWATQCKTETEDFVIKEYGCSRP